MKKSLNVILLIAYVAFAQTAVLLVKLGSGETTLACRAGNISVTINVKMLIGLCLYVCSFLLWILVLSRNNLSVVAPVITAANYIVPMAIGIIILREKMTVQQWIGATVILAGLLISCIRPGSAS